jgi:hypothetical protein
MSRGPPQRFGTIKREFFSHLGHNLFSGQNARNAPPRGKVPAARARAALKSLAARPYRSALARRVPRRPPPEATLRRESGVKCASNGFGKLRIGGRRHSLGLRPGISTKRTSSVLRLILPLLSFRAPTNVGAVGIAFKGGPGSSLAAISLKGIPTACA